MSIIKLIYKTDADAALVAAYEGFMCNVVGRQPDVSGSMGIYTPLKLIANMCGDEVYYASGNLFAGQYDKAKAALKKVIDSGKYALVPGDKYMDNFHIEGDGDEEKVFEINFEYNAGKTGWSGMIQRSSWMESNAMNWRAGNFIVSPQSVYSGIDGWGGLGVPQWFGDEFHENDGDSYRFKATLKHIDDAVYNMEYADPKLNEMSVEQKKTSKSVGIKDDVQLAICNWECP